MKGNELLQIERVVIDLGLKKEYRFFHVSDAHISYYDDESSQIDIEDAARCRKSWDEGKVFFANCFGEFCDDRYKTDAHLILDELVDHSVKFGADALVFTGDIMEKITDSNIRYMKKLVKNYPTKVIYTMGNHGYADAYGNKGNMYHRFEGIMKDPAFDVVEFDEFKFIIVDNSKLVLSEEQVKRFEEEVAKDKKIILCVHVPINLYEFTQNMQNRLDKYFLWGPDSECEYSRRFINTVAQNSDKFICVLSGHIHGATKFKIAENLTQYTASSALIGYGMELIIR